MFYQHMFEHFIIIKTIIQKKTIKKYNTVYETILEQV